MATNGTSEKDFHDRVVDHDESALSRAVTNGLPSESQQDDVHLREFLMKHHGTTDLNPLPSTSLEDPLNWPAWKKNCYLVLLSFHAFFALFMFAGLIPGYEQFAEDYHITVPKASYLTSVQVRLNITPSNHDHVCSLTRVSTDFIRRYRASLLEPAFLAFRSSTNSPDIDIGILHLQHCRSSSVLIWQPNHLQNSRRPFHQSSNGDWYCSRCRNILCA